MLKTALAERIGCYHLFNTSKQKENQQIILLCMHNIYLSSPRRDSKNS